jgi:hypothetical protein
MFKARGWVPLNPEGSRVLAAFDGERMVGVVCLNMIPHVEPLFVDLGYRGTGLAEELVKRMVDLLYAAQAPCAYVIADNPASARLAELNGMERIKVPVYRKVV